MYQLLTAGRRSTLLAIGGAGGVAALGVWFAAAHWPSGGSELLTPVPSITHAYAGNHLHGVAYVPEAEGVYLASHYGLFLLRDGKLFQVGDSRDDLMGFSRHPEEPEVLFASGHPRTGGNIGVVVSRDGGVSWEQIFMGVAEEVVDFHAMVASPVAPERLYGVYGGRLYVGDVAADDWRLAAGDGIDMGQGFCWGVPCLAAAADDADRVFAATPEGIYVTENAGESWRRLTGETGAVAGIAAHPERPEVLMAHTEAYGVALSEDGGESWTPKNEGLVLDPNDFIFDFAFDPEAPDRVFAASAHGFVFETEDAGANWRVILTPTGLPS